ncbi:MAG: 16S rRNA (guanine(527)-N(7))-methyltransferase RsmG [Elusimicrobia bacterium RIFCSPLOWO2_01_FULL_64_13]|nr:MAG: 16S rRNA (guanine(527)-N(7))-methyltransferase RsmG [Elusimicrobia bacterium RIFCSPHIGHO2_01_FULL_64_10]OGR97889.1 MAG: 16S rRNA (guanine(527)-N(7))-methyltransferase RsmG [Elusimicrobia bacterium RIFCSPLOWO2_01_FULL_64_13]
MAGDEESFVRFLEEALPTAPGPDEAARKFKAYHRAILEWNRKINLVSEGDLNRIWDRHFRDSLAPLAIFAGLGGGRLADVGSGAGFPGLALALALPDLEFFLVESNRKRSAFLEEVIKKTGAGNVKVVRERAETLGRDPDFRDRFDFGSARALAKPAAALEMVSPLVRPGGRVLLWAGTKDLEEDLKGVCAALRIRKAETRPVLLPGDDGPARRAIAVFEKIGPTPGDYPRRIGMARKRPLD